MAYGNFSWYPPGAPAVAVPPGQAKADPFGGDEVTLVPGRLRGYRQFRVTQEPGTVSVGHLREHWTEPTIRLTGLVADDVWPTTEAVPAVCHREVLIATGRYVVNPEESKVHPAGQRVPAKTCSCGFYACHSPHDTQVLAPTACACGKHAQRYGYGHVMGVVEGSGRVEIGDRGWRAERVRIVALHLPTPNYVSYVRAKPSIVTWSTPAGPVSVSDDYEVVYETCRHWPAQKSLLHQGLARTYQVPIFNNWADVIQFFPRTNLDALRAAKTDKPGT
jgi:hypothetical protein